MDDGRPRVPWLVAALVAPPLVVLVLPTISLVGANTEYFRSGLTAGIALYSAAFVVFVVGVLLYTILRHHSVGRVAVLAYMLAAPAWLLVSLADGIGLRRGLVLVVLALATLAAAFALRSVALRTSVEALGLAGLVLVGFLGVGVATDLAAAQAETPDEAAEDPAPAPTGDEDLPNVYHLLLDEFQTEQFTLLLDDDLEQRLAGFVWFEDAISEWAQTEVSLAAMVAADPYGFDEPLFAWIRRVFTEPRSSLRMLADAGYHTTGYLPAPWLYGRDQSFRFDERHVLADVAEFTSPLSDQAVLAVSLWVHAHLPRRLASLVVPDHHLTQLEEGALLPDDAPPISVAGMRAMLDRESRLDDRGRYTLVHLLLPHMPYVVDGDCRYRAGQQTGPAEQTRCALLLVDELLTTLDDLDRLEDSVVVIHADHGARFALRDGALVDVSDADRDDPERVAARARSLVLVKPAGVSPGSAGPLEVSDRPAVLRDIYPTIFAEAGIDVRFGDDRRSLLADAFPDRPLRHYYAYVKSYEQGQVNDGPLRRYVYEDGLVHFDRYVDVPGS